MKVKFNTSMRFRKFLNSLKLLYKEIKSSFQFGFLIFNLKIDVRRILSFYLISVIYSKYKSISYLQKMVTIDCQK